MEHSDCLRTLFFINGLPYVIVGDSGPSFVNSEFKEFCQKNGIDHVTICSLLSFFEWCSRKKAVQAFKNAIRKVCQIISSTPFGTLLSRFFFFVL